MKFVDFIRGIGRLTFGLLFSFAFYNFFLFMIFAFIDKVFGSSIFDKISILPLWVPIVVYVVGYILFTFWMAYKFVVILTNQGFFDEE